MIVAETTSKGESVSDCHLSDRAPPGFAPINSIRTPVLFDRPSKTTYGRGIDSDTLYDIPLDDVSTMPMQRVRKRGPNRVDNEHRLLHGEKLEYEKQGGQQLETGTNIKRPAAKRRKMVKCKGKKANLFQNPGITKPCLSRNKDLKAYIPAMQVAFSFQGRATTEEMVRNNANRITKTTLDTLPPLVPPSNKIFFGETVWGRNQRTKKASEYKKIIDKSLLTTYQAEALSIYDSYSHNLSFGDGILDPEAECLRPIIATTQPTQKPPNFSGPILSDADIPSPIDGEIFGEQFPEDVVYCNKRDEFDEGLDDADLLAIISDSILLEPETNHSLMCPEVTLGCISTQRITLTPTLGIRESLPQLDLSKVKDLGRESSSKGSLHILNPEQYDEYPLNEGDEEAILKLQELTNDVVEESRSPVNFQPCSNDPTSGRLCDISSQFSLPKPRDSIPLLDQLVPKPLHADKCSTQQLSTYSSAAEPTPIAREKELWSFMRSHHAMGEIQLGAITQSSASQIDPALIKFNEEGKNEYKPLKPFVRPCFPTLVRDRSSIIGVSTNSFLRVCFRIGEIFKEGTRWATLKQYPVIELFARVISSSREPDTTQQHFRLADLFHHRLPFLNGVLLNYKVTILVEEESEVFVGAEGMLARCLGKLQRDPKEPSGWLFHIINTRKTDWEEIRWTRKIVSAGLGNSKS